MTPPTLPDDLPPEDAPPLDKTYARYLDLYEHAPVGYLTLDRAERIIEINLTGASLLGIERRTLLQTPFAPFIANAYRPRWRQHIRAVLEHEGRHDCELALHRLDKTDTHVRLDSLRVAPPSDRPDPAPMVRITLTDITHSKRTEAQLQLLSAALDASANAVVITDRTGLIEWANPAFLTMTGYGIDEVFGHNPRDLVKSGRHEERFFQDLWQTIVAGKVWRGEIVNRRKDGSLYHEQQTITPVRDECGTIHHYIAIKQDVTERVEAERDLQVYRDNLEHIVAARTAELTASENRFRGIVEQSFVGIFILQDNYLRFANRRLAEILGYADPDEFVDKTPVVELIAPEDRERIARKIELRLNQTELHIHHDFVGLRANGSRVELEVHGRRIDHEGRPAIIGVVMDTTARKAAERAHEALLTEAERLARAKGEFLANMSHEIRTPLNAVLGLAQLGQRESAGRGAFATFSRILDAGELLLGVINDILDYSKIEAGKLTLEHSPVDIDKLVQRAVAMNAERARAKGLEFRLEKAADLPPGCLGDALRMTQILVNLLSNAVKFTESGNVTLSALRERDVLIFRVSDTGIGIGEEQIERLFDAFEQADNSTTRRFGGTGLGLAISKRLAELMGGTIGVVSQPNLGSLFEVRLPLIEAAPPEHAVVPAYTGSTTLSRLTGVRILAAEDNAVNRLVLTDMLSYEGAHLCCVENGLLAVERIKTEGADAWDIVLMDVQMPVMDGHEATRQIHAFAPHLPVVGLTAHALAEEREKCLASGMVAHVAKPIDIDTLVATIAHHVRRIATDAAAASSTIASAAAAAAECVAGQIDWRALAQRYPRRPDFARKLAATFVESDADTPDKLRAAVDAYDFDRVAAIAHGVKSVVGNLLATATQQQAAAVETAARRLDPDVIDLAYALADSLESLLAEAGRMAARGADAAK